MIATTFAVQKVRQTIWGRLPYSSLEGKLPEGYTEDRDNGEHVFEQLELVRLNVTREIDDYMRGTRKSVNELFKGANSGDPEAFRELELSNAFVERRKMPVVGRLSEEFLQYTMDTYSLIERFFKG